MIHKAQHRKQVGKYLLLARLHKIVTSTEATYVRIGISQLTAGFFRRNGFEIRARKPDGIAAGLDNIEMRMAISAGERAMIEARWSEIQHDKP